MRWTSSRGNEETPSSIEPYWTSFIEWILLLGDRRVVAFGFAGFFAVSIEALWMLGAIPLVDLMALYYAFSGLIAGNITLITVVVSINQLLLSQELQTPNELKPEIRGTIDYRNDVEETTNQIAPVKPLGFLQILIESTREEAQRLGGFAKDDVIQAGHAEVDDVVGEITEQMDRVDELLVDSNEDTFTVLSLTLKTNYAEQINRLRRIQSQYETDFEDRAHGSIEDLVDRLQDLDIARQYFKSLYLQQELATLSRVLLYAGLPAVAVTSASLLILTIPSGEPAAVPLLPVLLLVTPTIGLLPLAILCSFFLRTATITKRTAATLPFTTPEQER